MSRSAPRFKYSVLSSAVFAAVLAQPLTSAHAQDASPATNKPEEQKVLVTGSLIPQTSKETFQPITVITADDIKARSFNSVEEVLSASNMATGGVQGNQTSGGFTQGAQTVSLFGLPSGYIKFLIDGRPMSSYPALYNGSDVFNNISGIPIDLVDRIEILPGGQSSLYGSDAIAGVINIILKKQLDGVQLGVRKGFYSEGGGSSTRLSLADGFSAVNDRLNVVAGVQYEKNDPIWAYQRALTKQFNQNSYDPVTGAKNVPLASRDFLVNGIVNFGGYFGDPTTPHNGYVNLATLGANCNAVTGLFGGTEAQQFRSGSTHGTYCGSYSTPGYRTLQNGGTSTEGYAHGSFDVSDNVHVYSDLLLARTKSTFQVGSNFTWWGTSVDFGYFYDPNLDGLLNLQRNYAPEDFGSGGYNNATDTSIENSYNATLGVQGTIGKSDWDYDVNFSKAQDRLQEKQWVRWKDKTDQYFIDHVLGPQQGFDPYYDFYPAYTPNYAAFYQPISAADMKAMTGNITTHSSTFDETARAQVTNGTLFSLPGGKAGLALAAEWGKSGWRYDPASELSTGGPNGDGNVWGLTSTGASKGERTRYAGTSELRMPFLKQLSVTASARYDSFTSSSHTISKPTFALGFEFRPVEQLLLRGKYGTAFKAPSLANLYQGNSGYYQSGVIDYWQCFHKGGGVTPDHAADDCPSQYTGLDPLNSTSGNIALKPINAKVWNLGTVWAPVKKMSMSVDYYAWDIRDEVTQQSSDQILRQEYRCRSGLDDINSALCVATLSQVTRNTTTGALNGVYTPDINVSRESERALTAAFQYGANAGELGDLSFGAEYTTILNHKQQTYAGDPYINLLNNPYWSTDPKSKTQVTLGWSKDKYKAALYANWISSTPNYIASNSSSGDYSAPGAGKLPPHTIINASATVEVIEGLELSMMVNNLFNTMPPVDPYYPATSGSPYNSYNFNPYGREVMFELHWAFGKKK